MERELTAETGMGTLHATETVYPYSSRDRQRRTKRRPY
jgi:hypothetical protein